MKLSKEFKVGLFAVVAGVILYLGFNYLKGADLFSSTRRYYVVYDNIDGLTVSNPVILNGLAVGRVERIKLLPERNNTMLVMLEIDENITMGDSTKAELTDSGFLGGKTINLKIGPIGRRLNAEDTLIAEKHQGITAVIQQKAVPVLDKIDSTAAALNSIINEFKGTATKVKGTLANLEQSADVLKQTMEENRTNLKGITSNMNDLSSSLVDTEKRIKPVISKMDKFADTLNSMQLAKTVDNTNKTIADLNKVMTKVNRGEGSLGKLVNNDSLYNNLNNSSNSLDNLLRDIKTNPRRYINISVFGRKQKQE